MERIPASERTRERLKTLMDGKGEAADGRSELVRLAARLIIEEALEGEADDVLGRGYYARGAAPGSGHRNGYRTGRLKSAEGSIEYSAPQIAERAEPFRSRIRETLRGRTEELEDLAVEMYARGLSTRDIEALFADATGKSLLSRSAVSMITERLWAEYEGFASRDLAEFDVVYLSSMASPSGCIWASRARLSWRRGVSWRTARKRCCTSHRAPRRTRRVAASSSRTCAGAGCPIRCWS
jgi:putative transposase